MNVASIRSGVKLAVPTALLVGALALAPSTNADPVSGGKTVLKPDVDTFEALADMSIGVETTGGAKSGKNGLSFPVTGGDVNPAGPKGEIDHKGGLAFFTEGGGSVKFSKFVVKIGKNKTKVFAKSDKSEVRFFDLDLTDASVGGTDTSLKIKGAEATLAKQGAQVMSDVFDFPFQKGIPLGSVTVKASFG